MNPTIAPTGTGYTTDSAGTGRADFKFDQGYGYDDTVGKVVVVHDTVTSLGGTYARIACGVLGEVDESLGTKMWYARTKRYVILNSDGCFLDRVDLSLFSLTQTDNELLIVPTQ